ncbi:phosphotransferase [Actinomadura hibisca]|uniref:phosphotransferase n=1 Tax=Actinomadura hibisca TaxID=68565 RepID=UPI0012F89A92|nr:phosphotransferase [Actinomadura hibisca]
MQSPDGKQGGKLWTGTEQANTILPADVPHPCLLARIDWTRDGFAYRAELSEYVATATCSDNPALPEETVLSAVWWTRLRRAIDTIGALPLPPGRAPVVTQDYIHRAIPRYLGAAGIDTSDIDTTVRRWSLAHGDLHWANLTAPDLVLLDWEGFGPAPYGFDAAHLHAYTLTAPKAAAHLRTTLVHILERPEARLAELTVAAMILQAADRDPVHARLAPLVIDRIRAHTEQ